MIGLDKIKDEIRNEAAREADALLAAATAEADAIRDAARAEAELESAKIRTASQKAVADIEQSRDSVARLQRRQYILQMKQELLCETLDMALDTLYNLPDKKYFGLLCMQAVASAEAGHGEMLLNPRDAARLPAKFEAKLAADLPPSCSITVSSQTRPIDGGFVLKYGDVEQNCSFAALFDARREDFTDMIRRILFDE